jgi:hypothetical protein
MRRGDTEAVLPSPVRLNLVGVRSEVVKGGEDPLGKVRERAT